jgi:hypothetical protein
LLDAAIRESFILSQIKEGYGIAGQTIRSIALVDKTYKAAVDVLNGNMPQVQCFFGNIGAVKFYSKTNELANSSSK